MTQTVPKFIGFEIELANYLVGSIAEFNAEVAASSIVAAHHRLFGCRPDDVESCVNEFDTLGFRVYDDHSHAEIDSPLTPSARDLVFTARVACNFLHHCIQLAESELDCEIFVGLDNTNRNGVSWGSHLNLTVSRKAFDQWRTRDWIPLMRQWVPFICTSPGLFGAGKLGGEAHGRACPFQMSQRADFIDREIGLETVASKSLINERDEALADPSRFARFHVIPFDTNRCEFANWLKFGSCQLLLGLIEEGYPLPDLTLSDPLDAFATASRDLQFTKALQLADGREMTALELQYRLSESVADAVSTQKAETRVPDAATIVDLWIQTLDHLARNAPILNKRLDWRVRLELIGRACSASENPGQASIVADIQYGRIGGIFENLEHSGAVERLEDFLPPRTGFSQSTASREIARGILLDRFGARVLDVDWHFMVVKDESDEPWTISFDDPVNSASLLRIAETCTTWNKCLDQFRRSGIAKKCESDEALLVIDTSKRKGDCVS